MAQMNASYRVATINFDGFPCTALNGAFVMTDRILHGRPVFGTIPQYILYFQPSNQRWAIADKVAVSAIAQGEDRGIACEQTGGASSEAHGPIQRLNHHQCCQPAIRSGNI